MEKEQIAFENGYRVDEDGNLINKKGKFLKGHLRNGYYCFNVYSGTKRLFVRTHRLQAYIKYGDKMFDDGIIVRHLNGDSKDNSFGNISIGTQHDNMMDIPKNLRIAHAKKASSFTCVYSNKDVDDIKYLLSIGTTWKDVMKKYNITSKGTMSYIINKR